MPAILINWKIFRISNLVTPYIIGIIQSDIRYIMNPATKKEVISENLTRDIELINGLMRSGVKPKIVQFPEFFLTGFWPGRTIEEWLQVSIQIPGDETDKLSQEAIEHDLYIAGNNYEVDPDWPGRYFHTSFLISPEGKVILKYRSLTVTSTTFSTASSPGDFISEYVKKYGERSLFPVAETPLGKIAVTAGSILYPEAARCFVLNGAEVIISCLTAGPRFMSREVGRVRAWENTAYVGLGGAGRILGAEFPRTWSSGGATIIDYKGRIVAQTESLDEAIITGEVDINQLRVERARMQNNHICTIRGSIYGPIYQKSDTWPDDRWAGRPIQDRKEAEEVMREVQGRLYKKGVLVPPELD